MKRVLVLWTGIAAASLLMAQSQRPNYTGANVTGQLILVRTVNLLQQAQNTPPLQTQAIRASHLAGHLTARPSIHEVAPEMATGRLRSEALQRVDSTQRFTPASTPGLGVSFTYSGSGFNALSARDERLANGGNQLTIEPPSPSIAVGNGSVLEGVNNAVDIYSESGTPLLPQPLASNQVFGLMPTIDRSTNIRGPYLTDMRVFYDHGINRWFILQRSLDSDGSGKALNRSHLYIAVSQTGDPTQTYNIYIMDTTNPATGGCPCFSDFPQIGADQYGFYISADEYDTTYNNFVDASILAISKSSLASGASLPTAYRSVIRRSTGYEFAIQPASTPPGANYFTGSSGVEYFVSSIPSFGNTLAIWAMSNTSSLDTPTPNPVLSQIAIPALSYLSPDAVPQRPGPLPYGSSLRPPGTLAYLDGADSRVMSVSYAGGRLYATLGTQVIDENNHTLVGGAYFILSPTFRGGVLACFSLRQGYVIAKNNYLLRPAIAVNPQGHGAVAFTLVGPDYYPSAAFVTIDTASTGSIIQVAGPGALPEDGFTGYPGGFGVGIARWGDYSTAVAGTDGSIWMVAEYIPNAVRAPLANWGTFVIRYIF